MKLLNLHIIQTDSPVLLLQIAVTVGIPDKESAIKYAQIIYKNRTGNDYSDELFETMYLEDLNACKYNHA